MRSLAVHSPGSCPFRHATPKLGRDGVDLYCAYEDDDEDEEVPDCDDHNTFPDKCPLDVVTIRRSSTH